jgi:hypothetical protein
MAELPERPNLAQLRRQARELLRAAANGDPNAMHRLQAVSDRTTLTEAQLAIAREYGYESWPKLKADVEQRRSAGEPAVVPGLANAEPGVIVAPADRWSFGGGPAIEAAEGTLTPRTLLIDARQATLHASLVPSGTFRSESLRPRPSLVSRLPLVTKVLGSQSPRPPGPTLRDLSIVDDRGASYVLRVRSAGGPVHSTGRSQVVRGPMEMRLALEPVPDGGVRWLEIRNERGSVSRLVSSRSVPADVNRTAAAPASPTERELMQLARQLIHLRLLGAFDQSGKDMLLKRSTTVLARVAEMRASGELGISGELAGEVERLANSFIGDRPADGLPTSWSRLLNAEHQCDGRRFHADVRTSLPSLDGSILRLDAVVSEPDMWWVYLRADPSSDPQDSDVAAQPEHSLSVEAQDDLGGAYVSMRGRGTGHHDGEELALRFLPRLDPHAHRVKLRFGTAIAEVCVDLDLDLVTGS